MLAWETISSLQSLPLPFSELFRAFETAQNTAFLVILSHWAPPLSVSFLWAPQQPSDQLEFLRNVCAWPYTAACSSAFLLWLPKSNLYRLLTLVLWIFFFFSDFCSNPSPLLFLSVLHCLLLQVGFFSLQLLTLFFPARSFLICLSRWPRPIWLTQGKPDFLCFDCYCCRAGHFLLTWWTWCTFMLSPQENTSHTHLAGALGHWIQGIRSLSPVVFWFRDAFCQMSVFYLD